MVTKSLKLKEVQVPQPYRWLTRVSGGSHYASSSGIPGVLTKWGRFAEKIIKAMKGEKGIVEPTYVYLPGVNGGDAVAKETGVDYFSVPVELGVCRDSILNAAAFC